jgi:hypothetical protein
MIAYFLAFSHRSTRLARATRNCGYSLCVNTRMPRSPQTPNEIPDCNTWHVNIRHPDVLERVEVLNADIELDNNI